MKKNKQNKNKCIHEIQEKNYIYTGVHTRTHTSEQLKMQVPADQPHHQ